MKIVTIRFIGGTLVVALGLLSLLIGIFSFLPPTNNVIIGLVLVLIGAALMPFGFKVAKDDIPSAADTTIDTLHRAKLLDKTRKN